MRKRVLILGVVGFLAVAGLVGALTSHSSVGRTLRREVLCTYHGARAWQDLRHHHPLWTTYQLYRASHACHSTGRGY